MTDKKLIKDADGNTVATIIGGNGLTLADACDLAGFVWAAPGTRGNNEEYAGWITQDGTVYAPEDLYLA